MVDPESFNNAFLIAGCLVAVATFTGGLWATLLLRQIAGAFWLTLLVPAVLAGFTAAFFADSESDYAVIAVLCVVIAIYSVGGFLLSRWLFFRAQDVGWTGGIIALPQLKLFHGTFGKCRFNSQPKTDFCAFEKRIPIATGQLAGCRRIAGAAHRCHHCGCITNLRGSSAGEILTSIFWMLWLVLPVIIGAMAMAEERRLGMMEGQLCLPVSRRVQFVIKGFLTLVLGTLFGGGLPMFLETVTQNQVFTSSGIFKAENAFGADDFLAFQLGLVALAAWLALASFFASSLARNFLQAVGFAIATFVGTVLLGSALIDGRMFFLDSIPAHSVLPVVIAIPTAIATLLWLAYLNFKNFRDGWPLWRRNLLGLAGACVFIVVT